MRAVILDTDLLSEILKGVDPFVQKRKDAYVANHKQLTFTSVSLLEILSGYRKRGANAQRERADNLFSINVEVTPEQADYRLAADILGDLLAKGTPIGMVDPLISACAIRRGYGIASGNTKHFDFIRQAGYSFELEDWRRP